MFNKTKRLQAYAQNVQKQFEAYKSDITVEDKKYVVLTIYNPMVAGRNIEVIFKKREATFYFSYQHAHFAYEDDGLDQMIDYINAFINGDYAAVEFFRDGERAMGGSRTSESIDFTSAQSAVETYAGDNQELAEWIFEQFKQHEFKVCAQGWDGTKDMYAEIVWDGNAFAVKEIKAADVPSHK